MSWRTKKLGEITEILKLEKAPIGSWPYVEIGDINLENKSINFKDKKSIKGAIIAPKDSILISRVRPTRGAIVLVNKNYPVSSAFAILKAKQSEASSKFLFYWLSNLRRFFIYLQSRQKGSNYPSVREKDILNFEIFLPPLRIQKQIVERLDKIAEAQKLNDELIQKSDELFQSLLYKELNSAGKNWETKKLGNDDVLKIIDGDRGKNYPPQNEFQKSGFCLFLNTKNVTSAGFVFDKVDFISKERDEKLRKGKLQRNDVVLTTRGTVGNSALYDSSVEFNDVRINSGMVILRPNIEKITPNFLWLIISSGIIQKQFKQILSGTAQPQLPICNLIKTKFPFPPLSIQKQIVEKLSAVQEYKKKLLEQKQKLQELFDSVLNKSFKGQL